MKMLTGLALCAFLALSGPAWAQTVEVVVVMDPTVPAPESLPEYLMGGALDALFESGVIGTNIRPLSGSLESFMLYGPSAESAENYVDLVLVVFITFKRVGEAAMPSACRYRLVVAGTGLEEGNGRVEPVEPASASLADLEKACAATGAAVVAAAFPTD